MLERYPVEVEAEYPENPSRLLALLGVIWFPKLLLIIPHMVILYFLGIAAVVATYIAYWAVLITGRYPRSLFNFTVGVQRWSMRVNGWVFGWSDRYPPFNLR